MSCLRLLRLLVLACFAPAGHAEALTKPPDIRDISSRPEAPEFAYARFFATRPLQQPAFSADDRRLYFIGSSRLADNVFALDLADRSLHQVTRSPESISGFLVARGGGFLILLRDTRGNGRYDLYRFDLDHLPWT